MEIDLVAADGLSEAAFARWGELQQSSPVLRSPFFRPEFTRIVAQVRDDVEVAILRQGGDTVGFFPFQRVRRHLGVPVGGERSNYHGVIASNQTAWDVRELLRGCELHVWEFDHVPVGQAQFARCARTFDASPYMDLRGGFEEYARRKGEREGGSKVIRRLHQQARRIERHLGPLRFEPNVDDPALLRRMMSWKSAQYRDTGSEDRFARRWNVELLELIHAHQSPEFAGMLPVLYAGERLLSVAMCLRSRGTLHLWFPTYDRELASYSPGMLLLLLLAQSGESLGLDTIDLGKGSSPYKQRLATGAFELAVGSAMVPSPASAIRLGRARLENLVRRSPLESPARRLLTAARQAHRSLRPER